MSTDPEYLYRGKDSPVATYAEVRELGRTLAEKWRAENRLGGTYEYMGQPVHGSPIHTLEDYEDRYLIESRSKDVGYWARESVRHQLFLGTDGNFYEFKHSWDEYGPSTGRSNEELRWFHEASPSLLQSLDGVFVSTTRNEPYSGIMYLLNCLLQGTTPEQRPPPPHVQSTANQRQQGYNCCWCLLLCLLPLCLVLVGGYYFKEELTGSYYFQRVFTSKPTSVSQVSTAPTAVLDKKIMGSIPPRWQPVIEPEGMFLGPSRCQVAAPPNWDVINGHSPEMRGKAEYLKPGADAPEAEMSVSSENSSENWRAYQRAKITHYRGDPAIDRVSARVQTNDNLVLDIDGWKYLRYVNEGSFVCIAEVRFSSHDPPQPRSSKLASRILNTVGSIK